MKTNLLRWLLAASPILLGAGYDFSHVPDLRARCTRTLLADTQWTAVAEAAARRQRLAVMEADLNALEMRWQRNTTDIQRHGLQWLADDPVLYPFEELGGAIWTAQRVEWDQSMREYALYVARWRLLFFSHLTQAEQTPYDRVVREAGPYPIDAAIAFANTEIPAFVPDRMYKAFFFHRLRWADLSEPEWRDLWVASSLRFLHEHRNHPRLPAWLKKEFSHQLALYKDFHIEPCAALGVLRLMVKNFLSVP